MTRNEFEDWKLDYEENLRYQYLSKTGGMPNKFGEKVTYCQCNQSGIYKCVRKEKRRTKSSDTNKIDKNCTATLKVVTHEDQSVNHTHYSHTKQLQHLSDRVRKGIASKLHHGISKQ